MRNRKKQILCLVLAGLMTTLQPSTAMATNKAQAQQEKKDAQKGLDSANQKADQAQQQKNAAQAEVEDLKTELTGLLSDITLLEEDIKYKDSQIQQAQSDYDDALVREKEQYEAMKKRIRYMYEKGDTEYLDVLLKVKSMSDLLNKSEYISDIYDYDRKKLEEYQQTQALIQNAEETIRKDKADLEALQAQLEEEQQAVNLLMQEKETQLSGVRQGISEAEQNAQQYQQEIEAENQLIQEMLAAEAAAKKAAEEKKQQEVQKNNASADSNVNTNDVYEGGVFTWPCPSSHKITSGFGYRDKPTAGATSYHQGYDIGASAGAAIVAAADGVVTSTGYSSVLGNYVILSHGGGLFTIYEHCSAVLVSQGQSVSRGSTIAKVGSTGVSTGPHLHFGVQLNGKYVDPGNYLKG